MKQSRQSSVISNAEKLKYPKCDRKKQHNKESLNFICLTPTCKNRGLICVQCKSSQDHAGHSIQPVRAFLGKLEESIKKMKAGETSQKQVKHIRERQFIERLQQSHIQALSTLKCELQIVSERIQMCEEQIIKEYSRVKDKIISESEKQMLLLKSLEQINGFFLDERQKQGMFDLKMSMNKLLSLVKIDKNEILIQNEAETQLNSYILSSNIFKTNIIIWQKETINIIGQVFKLKIQYQAKETKNRPNTAGDPTSKLNPLSFSPQFKTESVILSNENKLAKVKDDKNGKIILLTQKALDYKIPIKFKVAALSSASTMQIGLCIKTNVSQKLYKFQKLNPLHSLFVCSSNGFIYSSNDQTLNNTKWNLLFKTGDEISIQVDQKDLKMLIKKKSDPKNYQISLKHLSQNDWKDLYYCVSLNAKDDKVQVM